MAARVGGSGGGQWVKQNQTIGVGMSTQRP